MEKKTAGLIIGKPKPSEFSTSVVESESNNPVIIKLYSKDIDIDFDLDNNIYINNVNNLITRGKNLVNELETSDENISKDKNIKCLRFFLESLETISLTTKKMAISTEILNLTASDKFKLTSRDIQLGSLEDLDGIDKEDEENIEYDFVLSNRKFSRWWTNILEPFMSKVTEFMTKYDTHTHGGTVPPPLGNDMIKDFKKINDEASSSEKLISSKTTKVI
jgi:hypothetical protein